MPNACVSWTIRLRRIQNQKYNVYILGDILRFSLLFKHILNLRHTTLMYINVKMNEIKNKKSASILTVVYNCYRHDARFSFSSSALHFAWKAHVQLGNLILHVILLQVQTHYYLSFYLSVYLSSNKTRSLYCNKKWSAYHEYSCIYGRFLFRGSLIINENAWFLRGSLRPSVRVRIAQMKLKSGWWIITAYPHVVSQ